jgi:hypothetical protein
MVRATFLNGLLTPVLVGILLAFVPNQVLSAEPEPPALPPEPAILKAKPLKPAPGDDELRKLLIARYNVAVAEMQARYAEISAGRANCDIAVEAARHLVDSGIELTDKPAEQLAFREKFLELAKEVERIIEAQVEAGKTGVGDLEKARYLRLDAEVQLLKVKRKAAKQQPR